MKVYIQEVKLWLPLPKRTKNVVTIFGNHFQQPVANAQAQNLFHVDDEVFKFFQKIMIMICAKYVVTFRISGLFTILSEAEKNFNMSSR